MTPRTVRAPRAGLLSAAVAVAVTLLVAGLGPATAPAAASTTVPAAVVTPTATTTDVGAPSWWVGDCDATRWGPLAKSMGWTGVGSHRLGAAYLGVPVCGPRPAVDGSPNVLWGRAGWGEAEWQCVELAQRFMAQVYGTAAFGANGSQVVNNYRTTYGGGLVRINNGTVGVAPVPGDIVSFTTPNNPYGHVVVVTSSTVDGNGNGTVTMLSQNDTATGWRTLPVTAWKLAGFGSLTPYAWLHDPAGRGNPLGDGTFVRVDGTSVTYRIAGGAPLRIGSWSVFGGWQPVTVVAQAQFDRLRTYPSDGTYVSDASTGAVYRFAGGAALPVDPADVAAMPGLATTTPVAVDGAALTRRDHVREYPVDATPVCRVDDASCYLVVGGAPLRVPDAEKATLPTWSAGRVTVVSRAAFAAGALRATPLDGTELCDVATSRCYTTAGGSPLVLDPLDASLVPGGTTARANTVAHWEFTHYEHLRSSPPDGTVVCTVRDNVCYVTAGRAPLPITAAAATSLPTLAIRNAPRVSGWEWTHPQHLLARPVDGTVLQAGQSGSVYVVTGGVAHYFPSMDSATVTGTPVVIDQSAVDNAGRTGAWSHLASTPSAVRLLSPVDPVTLRGSVVLTWDTPIASSAVTSYDVRIRTSTATTAWTAYAIPTALQRLTTTRVSVGIGPGQTKCFSLRATNRAGQVGPWSPVKCVSRPMDDTAATSLTTGWSRTTAASFYLGSTLRSVTRGATWTRANVTTNRVALVATTCPTCGSVNVYAGTTLVGKVDLRAATTTYQTLIALPRLATTTGRLSVVVTSVNGRLVQLDGVLAAKA